MEERILVVDDEKEVRDSIGNFLIPQGFITILAADEVQAFEEIKMKVPDIIILDVQLKRPVDGLDICKRIRQEYGHSIGIIMMSGIRKETVDRIVGLELGADVYLTKPFERSELGAQVRALLRRMQSKKQIAQDGWLKVDNHLRINFERRIVEAGGEEVHLTKLEFDLLKYLAERQGVPVNRSDLVDKVWGYEAGGDISDAAVNITVNRIRSKIEPDPANPRYILSEHGIGYRFEGQ